MGLELEVTPKPERYRLYLVGLTGEGEPRQTMHDEVCMVAGPEHLEQMGYQLVDKPEGA